MKWLVLILLCTASNLCGVILSWDRNSETNLLGYRVYWGSASRAYTSNLDVGNTNSVTLPTPLPGTTTFYAVTAYDTDLLENDPSDEVSYTAPRVPLHKVLNLRISGTNAVNTIKLLQSTDLTSGNTAWKETGQVFVPVSNGPTTYYKAVAPAPTKQFLSAKPPKAGKVITRNPPRPFVLPPMPPFDFHR